MLSNSESLMSSTIPETITVNRVDYHLPLVHALRAFVCVALALPGLPTCAQTKIMLVGDSFWQNDSMRQAIYDGLQEQEVKFDFVGSEGRGMGPAKTRSTVTDPDHEGIGSKQFIHVVRGRTDHASRRNTPLAELLKIYQPDIVSFHIGINDIYWNFDAPPDYLFQSVARSDKEILADVQAIVGLVQKHNNSAWVILTTVTPVGKAIKQSDAINRRIKAYNTLLADKIRTLAAGGIRAMLVDSHEAWGGSAQGHVTNDGLHPNELGYRLLAARWVSAIHRIAITKPATSDRRGLSPGFGYQATDEAAVDCKTRQGRCDHAATRLWCLSTPTKREWQTTSLLSFGESSPSDQIPCSGLLSLR